MFINHSIKMSILHEIINNTDKYVLVFGIEQRPTDRKEVCVLYVYNLSAKIALLYEPVGLESELQVSNNYTHSSCQNNALWLLRQEIHGKSPLSQFVRHFVQLPEPRIIYQDGDKNSQSYVMSKFKAILIDKGTALMIVKHVPHHSDYISTGSTILKTYFGKEKQCIETDECVKIDITTPHNIAKKMLKIWRKVSSPEHDLVDVMNM
jgi:hypothetical protein